MGRLVHACYASRRQLEMYLACCVGAIDFIVGVRKKLADCRGGRAKEKGLLHRRAFLLGRMESILLGVESQLSSSRAAEGLWQWSLCVAKIQAQPIAHSSQFHDQERKLPATGVENVSLLLILVKVKSARS